MSICRYSFCISPYSVRMRETAGKMWTRITPNTDTFYEVYMINLFQWWKYFHAIRNIYAFSRENDHISAGWNFIYCILRLLSQQWKPIFWFVEKVIFVCKSNFPIKGIFFKETHVFPLKISFLSNGNIILTSRKTKIFL